MFRRYFTDREAASPATKPAETRVRRSRRSRPGVESLEGRLLMSIGAPFQVDTPNGPVSDKGTAVTATSAGSGFSVVVWAEETQNQFGAFQPSDIRAQLFNAAGAKVGPEIFVAQAGAAEPSVAMDAYGDYVVSWTQREPNGNT
jgi:hypothetical protein